MKKIILIRHSKAENPVAGLSDFERSLTLKGKILSHLMAERMKELDPAPGLFITSPAFRALETAYIFASEYKIAPPAVISDMNIYHGMHHDYLIEMLGLTYEEADKVTIFGHNPEFTNTASWLASGGFEFMPKCGVLALSFKVNQWNEIRPSSGKIEYFLNPGNEL